ncbi:MAG: Mur ligase domain-containing protein [bacterium]|nr:Mur ligase domain-containing protein [bacterium]
MSGTVHLVGIGGVGMSALAQALLDAGGTVTGADRALGGSGARPGVLAALARAGVRLFPDDGSGIGPDTARVIVSTAVEETNRDLRCARARGIPVVHRAAALAELLAPRRLVAVAGTCGKSTVTAILGHLLAESGFDPVVVNGAQVVGWDAGGTRVGSTRKGTGAYAVAEVDESDKSLVAFKPFAAVVTNASADHYSKAEMDAVFDAFVRGVPGPVIDGRRTPMVPSAAARTIPLPGEHNAVNAECALRMAAALGADPARLAAAIRTFPGVERRLQRVGTCGGAVVYDDYAHNPEKLHAMLATLQAAYPKGVAVVWRPHGYAPLRKMLEALAAMFRATLRPCDELLVLPVYDAGGTTDRSLNSDALVARLNASPVRFVEGLEDAETHLRTHAPAFGALVVAGARDPELPVLARRLAGKE